MSAQYQPEMGVCYYPEHWPESLWESDASAMVAAGIKWVRIAEFAWSRYQPEAHKYDWDWLDRAIEILGQAGLNIVLSTPTATPPKWLEASMPDMLAVSSNGQKRHFGSRRHYSFSHQGYTQASLAIVEVLAKRYGQNPFIKAWQTDNEYGCHDTALSYCAAARDGFRVWLGARYGTIKALNTAWGNDFWSMNYNDFGQIDLPNFTVAEANPSHELDFRRYSSDKIAAFNKGQCDLLRQLSPGRSLSHNFMGMFTQFNHRDLARDLDIIAWDSYPIGMLQNMHSQSPANSAMLASCLRTGDPDFQAFHHDLYRGMGRLWIMEQQPGPVNWAASNPAPAPGAVRLWSWEAAAHGAEIISYFRWRQLPFAQEQMHAGLMLADNRPAPGLAEITQFFKEASALNWQQQIKADIALIYDYEAVWMAEIERQSEDFFHLRLVLDIYRAARQNGGSIDIIGPDSDLSGYKLILCPALLHLPEKTINALIACNAHIFAGPRTAAKTQNFHLPPALAGSPISKLTGFIAEQIDALPASHPLTCHYKNITGRVSIWHERGQFTGESEGLTSTGHPLLSHMNRASYLTGWPDEIILRAVMEDQFRKADILVHEMPEFLRVRRAGNLLIFTNYGDQTASLPDSYTHNIVLGDMHIPPAGITIMEIE